MNCSNCFFGGKGTYHDMDVLYCRKHAPRKVHGVGIGYEEQLFPIVTEDIWCGDYEPETVDWNPNSENKYETFRNHY